MLGKMEPAVRPMRYPVLTQAPGSAAEAGSPADLVARVRALEAHQADQEKHFGERLEAARRESFTKGRESALGEETAARRQAVAHLQAAIEDFRARQDEYLSHVEQEVVRLALAIAERVIRREAQMDPLLLAGAIRVALGQLAESTEVRLRVPAEQKEMWAETLALMPGLPSRPQVIADPELRSAEAILEAAAGSIDLGVRAQIAEIERGFFDLLEARPEAGPDRRSQTGLNDCPAGR
jgi:flagellar assembly protein FliH